MFTHIIIPLIFQFVFEGIAVTYVTSVFLNKDSKFNLLLLIGFLGGSATFLLRMFPVSFIIHTVLGFLILTVLITIFFKTSITYSFLALMKSVIILGILEIICINFFVKITGIELEIILDSPLLKTLSVLPQIILLLISGYIIKSLKRRGDENKIVSKNC